MKMLLESNFKVIPWVILMVAILSHTGLFQLLPLPMFKTTPDIVRNIFDLVIGTVHFTEDDVNTAINDELNDMTPTNEQTFDFIIVGAGSAGAAIASRLTETENVTVLLIEAGISENEIMDIPLLAPYLQLDEFINWDYDMEASKNYCRGMRLNQCKMPRGKVMGGSSVLNFMIATRGSKFDYDNWAAHGCDGWSWDDVFPIFKNLENFEVQSPEIQEEYHHTGGPLNIARAPYTTEAARAFLEGAEERGFPIVDYNGEDMIGYSLYQATVKDGERFSINRAYLYPAKNRSNLFLTKKSQATKILIDENTKEANGVEINKLGQTIRVLARKEVIVSCGAIESPKLLMLSGIGPAAQLAEKNIPVLKDAPVGENYMDHPVYLGLVFLVNDSVTIVTGEAILPTSSALPDYLNKREGPFTVLGGAEAVGFMKIDDLSARQGWPDMELILFGTSIGSDPLSTTALNIAPLPDLLYFKPILNRQSFMIFPSLIQPKSRGNVLLRSGSYLDDPIIIPNFFDDPDDMRKMILGIRESLKVIETEALQKYDARLPDYLVPGCATNVPDSDEYWECAVRTFGDTIWHPAGTCKMGAANDSTAVVDPRLKVIGIKNLRVADASIMPVIPAAHLNVPTVMIAEKLAQMVKEDWNLN